MPGQRLMDIGTFKENLYKALRKLREEEPCFFGVYGNRDLNEGGLSHLLACKITPLFPSYNVDCEYSLQLGGDPKESTTGKRVRPDIVIHKRGTNSRNLAVLEIKWDSNRKYPNADINKIPRYKKLDYDFGIAVRFCSDGCVADLKIYDYAASTWTNNLASEANAYPACAGHDASDNG